MKNKVEIKVVTNMVKKSNKLVSEVTIQAVRNNIVTCESFLYDFTPTQDQLNFIETYIQNGTYAFNLSDAELVYLVSEYLWTPADHFIKQFYKTLQGKHKEAHTYEIIKMIS